MKKYFAILAIALGLGAGVSLNQNQNSHSPQLSRIHFFWASAYADSSPVPAAITQVSADAASVSVAPTNFIADVTTAITSFTSLSTWFKIALILLLLECTLKMSFFDNLIWSKLGAFQTWGPGVVALAAGAAIMSGLQGFSWGGLLGYLASGSGAILFVGVLTTIVSVLSPGSTLAVILNAIVSVVGGDAATPALAPVSAKKK